MMAKGSPAPKSRGVFGTLGTTAADCGVLSIESASAPTPPSNAPPTVQRLCRGGGGGGDVMEQEQQKEMPEVKDDLDSIIDLQGSSGIFKWGSVLERVFSATKEAVMQKRGDGGIDQDVWLTAVVIAYLEAKMGERKDLWELVVQKARKCLKKKQANVEQIFKLAEGYIQTL